MADTYEGSSNEICEHGNSPEACVLCVDPGEECGRWINGRLGQECPYRG